MQEYIQGDDIMKMLLSQMKKNETAEIISVGKNSPLSRRLYDMGFTPGQKIKCCNISIFGSPIAYNIHDTKIAVRKKDADMIEVIV